MEKNYSLDKIARFVITANEFWLELYGSAGKYADENEYKEEKLFEKEIHESIKQKKNSYLKDYMAHYIAVSEELDTESLDTFKKLILLKSGIDLGEVENTIIKKGQDILSNNTIKNISEYKDLEIFHEYIKDKGILSDQEWAAEKLLGRSNNVP